MSVFDLAAKMNASRGDGSVAALSGAALLRYEDMLTEEQRQKYVALQQMARDELEDLDRELAAEIARAKKRLEELQEQKRAVKQIYDGASVRLGHAPAVELKEVSTEEFGESPQIPRLL
jgi:hypothetical protein